MKIEIWSDMVCPFCYIGKRKLENALAQFEHKDKVEIVWKSYLLNSETKTNPEESLVQHLATSKGWSIEQTKEVFANVTQMAKEVGLNYNFEKVVVANSVNAHKLLQLAKQHNKGSIVKEHLFNAYFISGRNIDSKDELLKIGLNAGLAEADINKAIDTDFYLEKIYHDIGEANRIGVRGVPYFVANSKYALSGAQPTDVFINFLNHSWKED